MVQLQSRLTTPKGRDGYSSQEQPLYQASIPTWYVLTSSMIRESTGTTKRTLSSMATTRRTPTEASFATQSKPVKHSSKPLLNQAEGHIWHQRLGHAGKDAIEQLPQSVTGTILKGPTTVECESCGVSKAHEVISRRPPTRSTVPFYRIHLDLIPGLITVERTIRNENSVY